MTDFFISYTGVDESWAAWIASVLEAAGYSVKIQAWDFRPGGNFVVEMHRAAAGSDRTIAVLSPDYLKSLYAMAEWTSAFAADPDGTKGKLVPVLVRKTDLDGLLTSIIHIKLEGLDETAAREALLKGLTPGRARPETGPGPAPPDPDAAKATLAALPLDKVPDPGPLPVGSRMPLAVNPLFIGREEALKTLARQLKVGRTSVGRVQIAAATGLGGIGKTQLASEFVHRYGHFFAGGVFWMSFAEASSVPAEVAACGRSLGLHPNFEVLTLEQQVRLMEEAWQSPIPRLLVFDSCEEEELLLRWCPRSGGSRVLVTSRRPEWFAGLGVRTVHLTTLPRPTSIELLRRFRPDISETEPALDGIVNDLGGLPLALHLAGSFLRAYRNAPFAQPANYLESLRATSLLDHPSLQGRGSGISPTGHVGHVGRLFTLSFERLDPNGDRDALAIALLARAVWFTPGEPIHRSLLLKTVHANAEDLTKGLLAEDALHRLIDLGLMEANDQKDLLIHPLVAAWAQGIDNSDEARLAVEEVILAEAARLARNPALAFKAAQKRDPIPSTTPTLPKPEEPSKPRVFISYAREDYASARRVYDELKVAGLNVWLDRESLLPGQKWKPMIEKAIQESDCFIALLSARTVTKKGWVQKELRQALDILEQMPEPDIFLIPVRLEECEPTHLALRDLHWVDLFPDWKEGMRKILKTLESL